MTLGRNLWVVLISFAAVAAVSVVWALLRSGDMAPAADIAKRGLTVIKRENLVFFGVIMPAVVALCSFYTYRRWYIGQPLQFLFLALGLGVALSILAAIFYRKAFYDFTFLHVVHIAVFGWLMPMFLKA